MNPVYEIGTAGVVVALFLAFGAVVGGFVLMPAAVRITAVGAALMFLGYQVVEFILQSFVVVAL